MSQQKYKVILSIKWHNNNEISCCGPSPPLGWNAKQAFKVSFPLKPHGGRFVLKNTAPCYIFSFASLTEAEGHPEWHLPFPPAALVPLSCRPGKCTPVSL